MISIITVGSYAQEKVTDEALYPVGGDTEFAIHGAYNSSFITENGFTPEDGFESAAGISLGVQYDYYFSKTWSIRGRFSYDYKGSKLEDVEITTDLHYLSLPVMAVWHFGKKKRWYLHFGPYAAYLTTAQLRIDDVSSSVTDSFDRFDFGTDIGVGVRIPAKKGKWFFIETDGQNSFGDPSKSENSDLTLARTTLGVGLVF